MDNIKNIKKTIHEKTNAAIYVDYENVIKRLKQYKVHPVNDLDFYRHLGRILKDNDINITKFISYANFDDVDFNKRDQTQIQSFGVETRHTCNDGKTVSDLQLTVDALIDLYKNSSIELFIIVSSDRDFIPLIKAIKLEDKLTYVISTKNGYNDVVNIYADYHSYIEDIFEFDKKQIILTEDKVEQEIKIGVEPSSIDETATSFAKEVSKYLYESPLWKKYIEDNDSKVGLLGYSDIIVKNIKKEWVRKDAIYSFNVAHTLGYINIININETLYIIEGANKKTVLE